MARMKINVGELVLSVKNYKVKFLCLTDQYISKGCHCFYDTHYFKNSYSLFYRNLAFKLHFK